MGLPAEEAHRVVDKRLEHVGDLARIAQIVVEQQRDEWRRRRAIPVEDALALVAEHVESAGLVVLARGRRRIPPGVGEVLCLVDDDRVDPVTGLELRCESAIWSGRSCFQNFSVSALAIASSGPRPRPELAEVVELARVGGLVAAWPFEVMRSR